VLISRFRYDAIFFHESSRSACWVGTDPPVELVWESSKAWSSRLPDGQWREVQYIDHDGHNPEIYKIICTLTKKGSRLEFNFSGTSPNARGLINCSYAGLQAACLTSTYINLCWDIPWNRGVREQRRHSTVQPVAGFRRGQIA